MMNVILAVKGEQAMVGMIITGHGSFASGLLSALKLLLGEPPLVWAVDFSEDQSTDELKENLLKAVSHSEESILILADIKGGSPYNQSVLIKSELKERNIEVVSGTNLPMLILGALERKDKTVEEVAKQVLVNGKAGIDQFILKTNLQTISDRDDGI